jgi:hypothetical protein
MTQARPQPQRTLPWLLALAVSAGCVDSAMMRAARGGDRPALGTALAAANERGKLSLSDAASLGHAVLEHDLRSASTPELAMARVRDLRACALDVDDLLADRMKSSDEAGGEAALERVETGALGDGAARAFATASDERRRAVGMWGMTRDRDRDVRLRGLVDGSALVRKGALHAIVAHDDPADYDAVLEVARKDPAPLLRSTAVRALSRMAGAPSDIANRLRDLWTSGDDGLREDVAAAFASRAIYPLGGHEALAHLLAVSRGNEAVGVAGVVLGANVEDASLQAQATAELASALADGGQRARIHAIAVAPIGREGANGSTTLLDALRVASHAEDLEVRLAALGRLASARAIPARDRDAAIASLEQLAEPTPSAPDSSVRARFLLAEAGDGRVQAWLEADLRAKDAAVRVRAADALAALGRASRAAPLLADDDPSVRSRAACAILVAAREGRH